MSTLYIWLLNILKYSPNLEPLPLSIFLERIPLYTILKGVELPGFEGKSQLSQLLVDEALIVSDMFKINQISALQLLLHGEDQLPQYPGTNSILQYWFCGIIIKIMAQITKSGVWALLIRR